MPRVPHSAMWTFAFLVTNIFVAAVRTSELIGRRCCEENQVLRSGDCFPSNNATSFSPPVYANLSQPLQTVAWHFKPLDCLNGYEREYFPLDGEYNSLEIEEDVIYLIRKDIFTYKSSPDFCVGLDAVKENRYTAAFCLPVIEKICNERTCVHKCCPEDELFSTGLRSCRKQNWTTFSPEFRGLDENEVEPPKDLVVVDGLPKCDLMALLDPKKLPKQRFFLLQNGTLFEPDYHQEYRVTTYCLDFRMDTEANIALVCTEAWSHTRTSIDGVAYTNAAGLLISCIVLLLMIALHLAAPPLLDLQSLCLLCYTVSLLVADATLLALSLLREDMNINYCIAIAYILQYSSLATLSWLNAMCFDVWRIIKTTVNLVRVTEITSNEKKKFIIYCAYAWGVPLIVIGSAVLYFLPYHQRYAEFLHKYKLYSPCGLTGDHAHLIYFYGFVGLLFFVNLVFLGHTIAMLIQAWGAFSCCSGDTTSPAFNRNRLDAFKQRFILFCLMTLCCLTNFLIIILSGKILTRDNWTSILQFFTSLQGFIVFLIFISNKKKREAICNLRRKAKSSVALAARKISRKVNWHVTDEHVVTLDADNSTSTKHTDDRTSEVGGSTQDAEMPSEGIANQGFEGAEQQENGEWDQNPQDRIKCDKGNKCASR